MAKKTLISIVDGDSSVREGTVDLIPLPVAHLSDLFERDVKTRELMWRMVPRSAFRSRHDYAQWNRRYCNQPVLGTPGGLRVELVRNNKSHKWQVQYVIGRRRVSVRSHSDYESADRDYRLAKSLFNLLGGESFIKVARTSRKARVL